MPSQPIHLPVLQPLGRVIRAPQIVGGFAPTTVATLDLSATGGVATFGGGTATKATVHTATTGVATFGGGTASKASTHTAAAGLATYGGGVASVTVAVTLTATNGLGTFGGGTATAAQAVTLTAAAGVATAGGGTATLAVTLTASSGFATAAGGTVTPATVHTAAAGVGTFGGGVAIASSVAAKFETLTDDFASLDTGLWTASGGATHDTDRIKLPVLSSYAAKLQTEVAFDLTDSYVYGQFTLPAVGSGSRQVFFIATPSANDDLAIYRNGSSIEARTKVGGAETTHNLSTSDTWWRIREASGTVYYDTSTDGTSWTNRWTQPTPAIDVELMYLVVLAGYYGTESAADAYFDNVNTTPSAPLNLTADAGATTFGGGTATPAATVTASSGAATFAGGTATKVTVHTAQGGQTTFGGGIASLAVTVTATGAITTYGGGAVTFSTATGLEATGGLATYTGGTAGLAFTYLATGIDVEGLYPSSGLYPGSGVYPAGGAGIEGLYPGPGVYPGSEVYPGGTVSATPLGALNFAGGTVTVIVGTVPTNHPPLNGDVTEPNRGGTILEALRSGVFDESLTGGVPFGR